MRTVEILQLVATAGGAVATYIGAMEARLIRRFRKADAVAPDRTMGKPGLNRVGEWRFQRLLASGVLVRTDEDRFFLDDDRRKIIRRARRKRVLTIVLPLLILTVILIAYLLAK